MKERMTHDIGLIDRNTGELFSEILNMKFIPMSSVKERWEECENDYEKMVYLIKNMHKMDKTSKAYQSGEYDEFFNAAELNNLVEEDFVAYSQSYAKMAETERAIEYTAAESYANGFSKGESVGFSKGESVGFSKGESVGFIAGVRKIAKNMKEKGFSVEEISETTGLSIAEINSL